MWWFGGVEIGCVVVGGVVVGRCGGRRTWVSVVVPEGCGAQLKCQSHDRRLPSGSG